MTTWERIAAAATKVILAVVPSLARYLWEHWPKTPPEKRAQQSPTGGDTPTTEGRNVG